MQDTFLVHLAQRGLVTLPKALRDAYHLKAGDDMTLLDLGGHFTFPTPLTGGCAWQQHPHSPAGAR